MKIYLERLKLQPNVLFNQSDTQIKTRHTDEFVSGLLVITQKIIAVITTMLNDIKRIINIIIHRWITLGFTSRRKHQPVGQKLLLWLGFLYISSGQHGLLLR